MRPAQSTLGASPKCAKTPLHRSAASCPHSFGLRISEMRSARSEQSLLVALMNPVDRDEGGAFMPSFRSLIRTPYLLRIILSMMSKQLPRRFADPFAGRGFTASARLRRFRVAVRRRHRGRGFAPASGRPRTSLRPLCGPMGFFAGRSDWI